jgi:hypothetical protein
LVNAGSDGKKYPLFESLYLGKEASSRIDVAGPTPGHWYMLAAMAKNIPYLSLYF